ncbi:hypothetical protein GA0070610_1768 [Micromonospora echinofusca]|uniref:Holin n=1 Tax=Micromonospora echinofusca TaxID=47858 RepID=A0A1C5G6N3_MICEH|nr:hypothetical protein [Micromonospora echinofusca]SCG15534.1 hypothetical protein GA0070610_1768 [Micromonospora echinofusca]
MTEPTQTRHPWRATARTIFAATVAALTLLPTVAVAGGIDTFPAVAQVVAVAAAITRVLALPGVEDFLERFLPFLAAAPVGDEPAASPVPPAPLPTRTTFRDNDFR